MPGTPKTLVVNSFGGLQLDRAELSRQNNTFTELGNFILDRTGAIRAIEIPTNVGHNFGSPVVFVGNYRRSSIDAAIIFALCENGKLYNYESGVLLAQFPAVNIPFVGTFVKRIEDETTNTVDTITYLLVTVANGPPWKWDGSANPPTTIGVSKPSAIGSYIVGFYLQDKDNLGAINLDDNVKINLDMRGLEILIARRYAWTYYNPITKHESSPTPLTTEMTLFPYERLQNQVYTSVVLHFPDPTNLPPYGTGYTQRRIYATKDGASELLLCTGIYGADPDSHAIGLGAVRVFDGLPLTDDLTKSPYWNVFGPNLDKPSDGFDVNRLIPVTGLSYGETVDLIENNTPANMEGEFITTDPSLVKPAPDDNEHNPPPAAEFGAIYQNRFFLISKDTPTDVVFSKIDDFESFPKENRISRPSNFFSDVVSLVNYNRRLIIAKKNQLTQLVGIDFSDFTIADIDNSIGVTSPRSASVREDVMFFISPSLGLAALSDEVVRKMGESIKPYIDENISFEDVSRNCIVQDAQRDLVLYSMRTKNGHNVIIIQDISEQFPFSLMHNIPSKIYSLQQVLLENGNYQILAGCEDGSVYQLYIGGMLQAAAVTQFLPQDDLYSRKVFRHLRVEGLEGYIRGDVLVAFKIDEKEFTALKPLMEIHPIGLAGQRLKIKFIINATHIIHGPFMIQGFKLDYEDLGVPR